MHALIFYVLGILFTFVLRQTFRFRYLCNGEYIPYATVFSFYIVTLLIFRKLIKPQLKNIKQ
jgi:membrane protein CcdC involved in cytochrome C biogenesis